MNLILTGVLIYLLLGIWGFYYLVRDKSTLNQWLDITALARLKDAQLGTGKLILYVAYAFTTLVVPWRLPKWIYKDIKLHFALRRAKKILQKHRGETKEIDELLKHLEE